MEEYRAPQASRETTLLRTWKRGRSAGLRPLRTDPAAASGAVGLLFPDRGPDALAQCLRHRAEIMGAVGVIEFLDHHLGIGRTVNLIVASRKDRAAVEDLAHFPLPSKSRRTAVAPPVTLEECDRASFVPVLVN